jgi:predicted RNase H-like HicB family nuclease
MEKYVVVIEKAGNNYSAFSPDVVGCIATGDTIEETIAEMKDALSFHLESLLEDGAELPLGKGLLHHLQPENINEYEPESLFVEVSVAIPYPA